MIYLLIFITLVFFLLNYQISKGDYLSPGPIFCLVFLASEIVVAVGQEAFHVIIHPITVGVLSLGFATFTLVLWLLQKKYDWEDHRLEETPVLNRRATPIDIPELWVWLLILVEIITVWTFYKYLRDLMVAYDVFPKTLTDRINLYDKLTKFMPKLYGRLGVGLPMIYRLGNPITNAGAFIMLYVIVYNFSAVRKVKISHLISVALLCVLIVMNGSRSPLLRVVTMALIMFYILECRNGRIRRGDPRLLKFIVILLVVVVLASILLLVFMGRTESDHDYFKYGFIYAGAPIVNLDTYLTHKKPDYGHQIIGAQTFRTFWNYVGKLLDIDWLRFGNINKFAFSRNKIEIGNVYTMYYPILYDFNILGIIPLVGIMAWVYGKLYRKTAKDGKRRFDFRLFLYGYLFNDLLFSFFSCRFYETIGDAPFLKLLLFTWIFVEVIIEDKLHLNQYMRDPRLIFKKRKRKSRQKLYNN